MKAQIWHKNGWFKNEGDPVTIINYFSKLLWQSGFTIVGYADKRFQPYGFSVVWLLGESHFVVHTFPEEERLYWELASCNQKMFNKFLGSFTEDLDIQKLKGVRKEKN